MRLITLLFILNILLSNVLAEDIEVGQVVILKGEAQVLRKSITNPIKEKSLVNELDIITTANKSLVKITFVDKTNLILGPNSKLEIQKFSKDNRINIFNFLKGNFRVKIQEKLSANQKLEFLSHQVSVGARGTEFLTNAYTANSQKVSDVFLLEGNLSTAVEQTDSFILKAGEAINTSTYKLSNEIKKIDPKLLAELLKDELKLLPNMLDISGNLKTLEGDASVNIPKAALPTTGLALGAAGSAKIVGLKNSEKKRKLIIKEKINLKNEPWDIRDAILRKKELRVDNRCFYWFYKSLPGSGELERFRRERDCDEFEYDL